MKRIPKLTLRENWDDYERDVIPAQVAPGDRRKAKLAFYAGAAAIISVNIRIGEDDVSEEQGLEILDSLYAEVRAFADGAKRAARRRGGPR